MEEHSYNEMLHNKMSLQWNGQQNVTMTKEYTHIHKHTHQEMTWQLGCLITF